MKPIKNLLVMKYICTDNSTISVIKKTFRFLKLLTISMVIISCEFKENLVDVKIVDPVRHYYPIVQGEELNIVIELQNKSDYPFKITDILTSCGCVVLKKGTFDVIPAQSTGFVELTYDSNKNIGLVNHYIYFYGNLKDSDKLETNFDVHVVPNALYTPDYEELHRKDVEKKGGVKEMVDGKPSEKKYYVSLEEDEKS